MTPIQRTPVDFSSLELQKDPQANERFYQVSDEMRVIECPITREKSALKGFIYFKPEFLTIGAALGTLGDESVLGLLNSRISNAVYARAAASINNKLRAKKDTETKEQYETYCKAEIAKILLVTPVLVSPEDAYNFVPGDQDLTPKSLINRIKKITTEGMEAFKNGKIDEGTALFDQVKTLNIKLAELLNQITESAQDAVAGAADEPATN